MGGGEGVDNCGIDRRMSESVLMCSHTLSDVGAACICISAYTWQLPQFRRRTCTHASHLDRFLATGLHPARMSCPPRETQRGLVASLSLSSLYPLARNTSRAFVDQSWVDALFLCIGALRFRGFLSQKRDKDQRRDNLQKAYTFHVFSSFFLLKLCEKSLVYFPSNIYLRK